ncbi:hypothetical protein BZA05DRAFT_447808 [Tricharina praecox]|uniref:uncharacterized protein n=1 Tax=Tricharina praecox TaxID=43433 RepID=UPI002220A48A|nr:uncharacterized protein BZA05DRAFT_447808 [Tricharina praecox]KAI5845482.1 hypothetical protein BZA05DRAFT_447808 [Tricharina praecox]
MVTARPQCDSLRKECTELHARCVRLEGHLADVTPPAAVENGSTDAEGREESPSTPNHERPGRIDRKAARAAARAAAAVNIAAQEADAAIADTAGVLASEAPDLAESGSTPSGGDAPIRDLVSSSDDHCSSSPMWSSAKLNAATHSFPADVHIPGELSWPVSNKSEYFRAVTVELPLPAKQASDMVHVITASPHRGADAWASQLSPETRFYGTTLLVVLVAGVVGA